MKLPNAVGLLAAVSSMLTPAFAEEPDAWRLPDFSAVEAIAALGGRVPISKIYHADSRFRVESGPGYANIYLPAANRVYSLFGTDRPRTDCIYEPMDKASMMRSPIQELSAVKVDRRNVGTEVVDGHTCKVTNVVVTTAEGVVGRGRVWEAQDLDGFPVKVEWRTGQKLTAVYRNVVLATPDPALFEPPANCIPIEKAGEVAEELPPPEQ